MSYDNHIYNPSTDEWVLSVVVTQKFQSSDIQRFQAEKDRKQSISTIPMNNQYCGTALCNAAWYPSLICAAIPAAQIGYSLETTISILVCLPKILICYFTPLVLVNLYLKINKSRYTPTNCNFEMEYERTTTNFLQLQQRHSKARVK